MDVVQVFVRVVVAIVVAAVFVAILSGVSRRILGVPVGRIRAAAAAIVASGAELGFESQVVWRQASNGVALIPVQVGILFLVALAFLVLAELALPAGSLPRPDRWLAAARASWARTRRYSQITRIAARHNLIAFPRRKRQVGDLHAFDAGQARELRLALQEAGVTFVKLGQVLSTRADLLPAEYIDELSRLQQHVAPLPWTAVRAVLAAELGTAPEEVFAEIDEEPLAAASIGQVHRARLHGGAEVVVKIQRPGIGPIIERDLDIAGRLARTLQTGTDWGRSLGTVALAEGFADAIREELDYRIEARNAVDMAAAAGEDGIAIPRIHAALSTRRVLVMDLMPGVTLSALARGSAPVGSWPVERREGDAKALFTDILRQVLVDGVFHADPHPGNIMLLTDGRLALLDFGSVGRLGPDLRAGLEATLMAVDNTDPQALGDALLTILRRPESLDEPALHRDLGRFIAAHLAPGATADMAMFTTLLRILTGHRLAVPAEIATAFRTLAVIDGTLRTLAPAFDMVGQSRTFAAAQVRARLAPANLGKGAVDEAIAALPHLRRLPRQIDQLAEALTDGRISVRIRTLADPHDRAVITGIVHMVVLAFLAGTSGLAATVLLTSAGGPPVTGALGLYQLFGYLLTIVSAILTLRVVLDIFRSHPD